MNNDNGNRMGFSSTSPSPQKGFYKAYHPPPMTMNNNYNYRPAGGMRSYSSYNYDYEEAEIPPRFLKKKQAEEDKDKMVKRVQVPSLVLQEARKMKVRQIGQCHAKSDINKDKNKVITSSSGPLKSPPIRKTVTNIKVKGTFETASKMVQNKMFVVKRDGRTEEVHFDKITSRIEKLCYGLNMDFVDPPAITLEVISGLLPL